MEYIIAYNADSDFVMVFNEEQAKGEIIALVKDGTAHNDITLYKVEEVSFEIITTGLEVDIKE